MHTYRTGQIASLTGLHPNTIRFYETIGFLSKPERLPNGYRVFTQLHLEQVRLIRLALRAEVLQNGLRKQAIEILRLSADKRFLDAKKETRRYICQIDREIRFAQNAVESAESILRRQSLPDLPVLLRKEAAEKLDVTVDTLRNWERNGLVSIRRLENGYRVYRPAELQRLVLIRTLRCANYSLASILRLLGSLSEYSAVEIAQALNTPEEQEEIVSVCDHLLSALADAKHDAQAMLAQLKKMRSIATLQ